MKAADRPLVALTAAALTVLALFAGSASCASVALAPLRSERSAGPAARRAFHRVVALPATCGTFDTGAADPRDAAGGVVPTCDSTLPPAVDEIVRSAADFAGWQVIDPERVNAVAATRREVERRRGDREGDRTTELEGSLFTDATPSEQAAILKELGADGWLIPRIEVGAGIGVTGRSQVLAQVQLRGTDGAFAWAHRCEVEVAAYRVNAAVERAARCAVTDLQGAGGPPDGRAPAEAGTN